MSTVEEIRNKRLEKLKNIENKGIAAYPVETKRTHTINEAILNFDDLSKEEKEIILAGRILSLRSHGAITFINFEDGERKIQAFLAKDFLGEKKYDFFINNFDIGDFVEIRGVLFETKKGEKTIKASGYKLLSKSLRPLPEKWHGLKDVEERYRKRYLDLICDPDVKKKFILRSKIIKEIRTFLEKEGFMGVETPILQPLYGGAKARPFITHLNALDIDLYLRISPELYLKRLLVGGFEKVYEIGKCFRNEGVDKYHNPDFTMLEFYWAYADYKQLMKLTERMLQNVIENVFGVLKITYQDKEIDFSGKWERIEFSDLLEKYTKIKFYDLDEEALRNKAWELGVEVSKTAGKAETADEIYKKYCREKIVNPTFIIHHPKEFQPLAKQLEKDSEKLANFQLIVGGIEMVNAFSELNSPIEQRRRFEEQKKLLEAGFEEAQRLDEDFIEALEYAMPPAAGFGMGLERLIILLTDSNSLREVILFPIMKEKK